MLSPIKSSLKADVFSQVTVVNKALRKTSESILDEYRPYVINYARFHKSARMMQKDDFKMTMRNLQVEFNLNNTLGMVKLSNDR